MKTKTILLTFVAAFLISSYSYSQIDPKIYGDASDFKLMEKRTLVVQLMEEDPDVIKKLSKKEKRAGQLKEYKEFISDYNELIQLTVPKYWTYNQNIEFKTESDVKKLQKAKDKKYVLLVYVELSDFAWHPSERSGLTVPVLVYQRMEIPVTKPDYKLYIPSSFIREENKYMECDFKVALQCMQANIKWILKNKEVLQFNQYAEEVAKSNCKKLKDAILLVEKDFLHKMTEAQVTKAYGNKVEITDADGINKACLDTMQGKAAVLSIPYGIAEGRMGPIVSNTLVFFKIVVDCATGEILWSDNPGKLPIGKNVTYKLMGKEFENMKACKM